MRIPFDSFTLAAVVAELQPYVGGKLQRIVQPDPLEMSMHLYAGGREAFFSISCDSIFARALFTTRRPSSSETIYSLCSAMRARVDGARLLVAEQVGLDRILRLTFQRAGDTHTLIAELMGKHSNLILVDEQEKIVAVAKRVPASKSKRPIQPGAIYKPPPFDPKPSLMDASPGDDLRAFEGASPFLIDLIAGGGTSLGVIQSAIRDGFSPSEAVLAVGSGAYPISVAALGIKEVAKPSISLALEMHYAQAIPAYQAEHLRSTLLGRLKRVVLAREVALADLSEATEAASKAGGLQLQGELLLAYAGSIRPGSSLFETQDYEGNPLLVKLDPAKSALENANAYFEKAKKAKARSGMVQDQVVRLTSDLGQVQALISEVEEEKSLDRLRELQVKAEEKRWLIEQPKPTSIKEERPYEGHRIKELLGPGGLRVLYGENSEANDYLTLRVARPNDWWLHVRGGISAHVVISTQNKPEAVGKEALAFAAKVAVHNSPSKHSGYVAVDYTLKKYVRRPKGAPKGTVLYTHEKTLHVEKA